MAEIDIDLLSWTDLPKEIGPDFVSHKGDYDFPLYLSEKEEWIHLKNTKCKTIFRGPCLIVELNRFVPYLYNRQVKFHVLNMPHIRVGRIEIAGFVVGSSEDARFLKYIVDDGTGIITVFQDKKYFARAIRDRAKIDEKYYKYTRGSKIDIKLLKTQECPHKFPDPRPKFNYPEGTSIKDMHIFEHNWSLETNNGTLGRRIELCQYLRAAGYATLDFLYKRPQKEIKFEDLSNAKLNFLAMKITCLSEHEYNEKLLFWLEKVIPRRYDEPKPTSKK